MIYLLLTWLLAPLAALRLFFTPHVAVPRKILLIQTAKIGDYICTTPLLRALRASFPDAHIAVLVNPLNEPLARHQPGVDQVLTLVGGAMRGLVGRWRFYRLLRENDFDTTICISPNQAFLLVPYLAGVERRASILPNYNGRSYRLAAPFLNVTETHRQGRMMVETGMALLRQLGVEGDLPNKELAPAPGAADRITGILQQSVSGRLLGVGVSSGNKLKELGKDKLLELALRLLEFDPNTTIVFIGSSHDSALAGELTKMLPAKRVIDTTARIALADLPALLDRLAAYVGVDSGITYMADARNIPVVDVMGPADPEDQRPTGQMALIIKPDVRCAPCSHAFLAPYSCAMTTRACVSSPDLPEMIARCVSRILRNEL